MRSMILVVCVVKILDIYMMAVSTDGSRGKCLKLWSQEVKIQDHTRPDIDLEAGLAEASFSSRLDRVVFLVIMPRPRRGGGGIRRSSASVCPSDVAYMGSNSKTKRPRKTKLCAGVPQVTCDSHTDFKVKRSKVKVTGRGHIVAAT